MPRLYQLNEIPEVKITWPIDKDTPVAMIQPDGVTIRTTVGHVVEIYQEQNKKPDA